MNQASSTTCQHARDMTGTELPPGRRLGQSRQLREEELTRQRGAPEPSGWWSRPRPNPPPTPVPSMHQFHRGQQPRCPGRTKLKSGPFPKVKSAAASGQARRAGGVEPATPTSK